jgi:hypothetical protein
MIIHQMFWFRLIFNLSIAFMTTFSSIIYIHLKLNFFRILRQLQKQLKTGG